MGPCGLVHHIDSSNGQGKWSRSDGTWYSGEEGSSVEPVKGYLLSLRKVWAYLEELPSMTTLARAKCELNARLSSAATTDDGS